MMNTRERNRIKKYKNSRGIARMWHYIVIALTMGNVDEAVEQYDREEEMRQSEVIDTFASREQTAERCAPVPSHTSSYSINEEEEQSDIDLLTAAVLAEHIINNPDTGVYDVTDTTEEVFGGGGDFSGGGAGGSWDSDSY